MELLYVTNDLFSKRNAFASMTAVLRETFPFYWFNLLTILQPTEICTHLYSYPWLTGHTYCEAMLTLCDHVLSFPLFGQLVLQTLLTLLYFLIFSVRSDSVHRLSDSRLVIT